VLFPLMFENLLHPVGVDLELNVAVTVWYCFTYWQQYTNIFSNRW